MGGGSVDAVPKRGGQLEKERGGQGASIRPTDCTAPRILGRMGCEECCKKQPSRHVGTEQSCFSGSILYGIHYKSQSFFARNNHQIIRPVSVENLQTPPPHPLTNRRMCGSMAPNSRHSGRASKWIIENGKLKMEVSAARMIKIVGLNPTCRAP